MTKSRIWRRVDDHAPGPPGRNVLLLECKHTVSRKVSKGIPPKVVCAQCEESPPPERPNIPITPTVPPLERTENETPKEDNNEMSKKIPPTPINASPEVTPLLHQVYTAREMKRAAEKMEKESLGKLKQHINALCAEHPEANGSLQIGAWVVKRQEGVTRTIVADLLMAKGIAPDVIAECTKETSYYKYVIGSDAENGEG